MSGRRGKLLPNRERDLSALTDEESEDDEAPLRKRNTGKLKLSRNEIIAIVVGSVVILCAIFLFVIIGVVTAGTSNQDGSSPTGDQLLLSGRLPSSISPELYTIELQLDMTSKAVNGSVRIDATVTTPTTFVVLHAKNMTVASVEISQGGNLAIVEKFYLRNEYFVVQLASPVRVGALRITIVFNYILATDLAGFYQSSYVTSGGQRKYLACTQFEPTSARRAFPCFDEPDMKANFSVSIIHDAALGATSNMPVKSYETLTNNQRRTVFDTSVRMSTYLVAFVVSDFKNITNVTAENPKISVWSKPEALNETEYALDVAVKVLKYYETFFNIKYPLPKQDLFAIPDFSAGAMENWGLITYRETTLLYNPETAPAWAKQRVAIVVAHELAHQWFGNLVTMKWWNDLWLNEGFASYVEYVGADIADKSLHMQDQFIISAYQPALKLDSLSASHPIEAEVSSVDEIDSQFDEISYEKGASILRMLNHYLGDDAFKEGLHVYLTRHSYGNAVMADLWTALDSVPTDVPVAVKELMSTWTEQMGFPVIDVQMRADGKVALQQKRFLTVQPESGSSMAASPFNYKWIVPLNYITSSSTKKVTTLVLRQEPMTITLSASDEWVKFNVNHTAFVRVNYDEEGWQKLSKLFLTSIQSNEVLTAVDRSGLIDDAFALASSGYPNIRIDTPLTLVHHLGMAQEKAYVPWSTAMSWLKTIGTQLQYSPIFGQFKERVKQIIRGRRLQFPWNATGETLSHNDILLRSLLFDVSLKFGDESVLDEAYKLFQGFVVNNTRIDPNLKDVVYGAGVAKGSDSEWDYLWNIYNTTTDPQEQSIILRALAQSKHLWILNRYLQYAVTKVRSQDTLYVVHYIAQNEYGLQLAWDMFVQHWPHLMTRYGIGSFAMRRILHTFGKSFNTPAQLKEFQEFFADDTIRQSRGVQQAIEMLRGNIWWQMHVYPDVEKWLRHPPR